MSKNNLRIAVLHPGAMGASVGSALRVGGRSVYWLPTQRSDATRSRAKRAQLVALDSAELLRTDVDGVISICPPEAAFEVARQVAATGFSGTYVDANAISPATAREIGVFIAHVGARFVDGGIVGPPAWRAGTTRLFLSGEGAADVARWFEGGPLECVTLGEESGAASALKMCYAAYTKGSAALLLAIRALAEREGVARELVAEWRRSQPGLAERAETGATGAAPKAWRFAGEMDEIAHTFENAGLPGGFHHGAAALYRRLVEFKDRESVQLDEVVDVLLDRSRLPKRKET